MFFPKLKHSLLPQHWFNNANESYNHVIKRTTNWVVQKLPDMIEKLQELEQCQTLDVRGTMHDSGKYCLATQASVLHVSHATWTQLSPDQRSRRFMK